MSTEIKLAENVLYKIINREKLNIGANEDIMLSNCKAIVIDNADNVKLIKSESFKLASTDVLIFAYHDVNLKWEDNWLTIAFSWKWSFDENTIYQDIKNIRSFFNESDEGKVINSNIEILQDLTINAEKSNIKANIELNRQPNQKKIIELFNNQMNEIYQRYKKIFSLIDKKQEEIAGIEVVEIVKNFSNNMNGLISTIVREGQINQNTINLLQEMMKVIGSETQIRVIYQELMKIKESLKQEFEEINRWQTSLSENIAQIVNSQCEKLQIKHMDKEEKNNINKYLKNREDIEEEKTDKKKKDGNKKEDQ